MKFLIYFCIFFVITFALDKEVVEDSVKEEVKGEAVKALHESRLKHEKTRVCTCKQFDECIEKAREQANQCFTPCYDEFAKLKLLEKPELLKNCISEKEKLLDQLLPCVKENLDACSEKTSEKAANIDLDTFISKVEDDVDHRAQTLLRAVKSKELDKLATATKSYFMCFKNCFMNVKNPNGFCHEQMGCTLDITDRAVNKTISVCGSKVDWAKELGDVCSCAEKAGLGVLHDYCAMLDEFTD